MAKKFEIPDFYRSSIISKIKEQRRTSDRYKKDMSPTVIDLGRIRIKLARHFGFCYGVENAIEIAYRALRENPGRTVYLLSEMIHNPHVNEDLKRNGVKFLLQPDGHQIIPFESLSRDDIVIVPAFGTTVELFDKLETLGINPYVYNTTCPFVEKVWNRAAQLGDQGYTVIIHGFHNHEETRATFSHSRISAPSLVIRDLEEASLLASYVAGDKDWSNFQMDFAGRYSEGFKPDKHLERIGVVNQTTMLATETEAISNMLREAIKDRFGKAEDRFADTRDTLCYATYENQAAIFGMLDSDGDIVLVVGGYNSSNTSHLVEICEKQLPTYYIKDADEILSLKRIRHLQLPEKTVKESENWFPVGTLSASENDVDIMITAGASCPDVLVDQVIYRIADLLDLTERLETEASRL